MRTTLQQSQASLGDDAKHKFVMDLGDGEVIDASQKGSILRFVNHSCGPNAETQKWLVHGRRRIGLFALTDIQPGDEVSRPLARPQESPTFRRAETQCAVACHLERTFAKSPCAKQTTKQIVLSISLAPPASKSAGNALLHHDGIIETRPREIADRNRRDPPQLDEEAKIGVTSTGTGERLLLWCAVPSSRLRGSERDSDEQICFCTALKSELPHWRSP